MAGWTSLVVLVCLVPLFSRADSETMVKSASERDTLTSQNAKLKKDTILGYFDTTGSADYKTFTDATSQYKNRYAFAVTSNKDAVRDLRDYVDDEKTSIWIIKCSGVSKCTSHKFKDNYDTDALHRFLRNADQPLIIDLTVENDPFRGRDIHYMYVFYTGATRDLIMPQLEEVRNSFYGIIGMLTINMDHKDPYLFDYVPQAMPPPAVSFYFRWRELATVKPPGMHAMVFVHHVLSKVVKTNLGKLPEYNAVERHGPTLDHRLVEDDRVTLAALKAYDQEVNRQLVPALNDKTFYTHVKAKKLTMVIFYMNITPSSVMTLRHLADAAQIVSKNPDIAFGSVNCQDWTDVCAHEKIKHYPTVLVYRPGRNTAQYNGLLAKSAFVDAALLYNLQSPLELSSMSDYEAFSQGDLPRHVDKHTAVSILGLFSAKSGKEYDTFRTEAMKHDGLYVFAVATGDLAKQIASSRSVSVPTAISFRRNDKLQPEQTFAGVWTSADMNRFIDSQTLCSFPQLTVATLPTYLAQQKPFVILFTPDTNDEAYAAVAEVAKSQEFSQLIFGWMPANDELAMSMRSEYGAAVAPSVTMVNQATRAVHNFDQGMITQYTLANWLKAIVAGKLAPSKSLTTRDWKPLLSDFDFLSKIDADDALRRQGLTAELHVGKPPRIEL